jgi:hypothetical protein
LEVTSSTHFRPRSQEFDRLLDGIDEAYRRIEASRRKIVRLLDDIAIGCRTLGIARHRASSRSFLHSHPVAGNDFLSYRFPIFFGERCGGTALQAFDYFGLDLLANKLAAISFYKIGQIFYRSMVTARGNLLLNEITDAFR